MSELEGYFKELKRKVDLAYDVAGKARLKGLDSVDSVECPLAMTMAERSVNLIKTIYPKLSVDKISNRILELENDFGKLDSTVAFIIAREIGEGKFGKFESLLERIGFSNHGYQTPFRLFDHKFRPFQKFRRHKPLVQLPEHFELP